MNMKLQTERREQARRPEKVWYERAEKEEKRVPFISVRKRLGIELPFRGEKVMFDWRLTMG